MNKGRHITPPEDFAFLPDILVQRCFNSIESFHSVHGYQSLPDLLWRSKLGPFIQKHKVLSSLLKTASKARKAKKSNEEFCKIAATILAMEILATNFAGWGRLFPEAAENARVILRRIAINLQTPLLDHYVYPAKYISAEAITALSPPTA